MQPFFKFVVMFNVHLCFHGSIYKFSQSSNQISGMPEKVQSPYEEYKQRPKKRMNLCAFLDWKPIPTDSDTYRYDHAQTPQTTHQEKPWQEAPVPFCGTFLTCCRLHIRHLGKKQEKRVTPSHSFSRCFQPISRY